MVLPITPSSTYKKPGSAKSTATSEMLTPTPKNQPICLSTPWLEIAWMRNPQMSSTEPEVRTGMVQASMVSSMASRLCMVTRSSR